MSSSRSSSFRLVLAAAAFAVAGCGGGGGSSTSSSNAPPPPPPPPPASPAIQVLPTTFDFGKVTTNNTPAPLEVTIRNTGNASLRVSGVSLLAPSAGPFALAVNGGSKPCASATPSVAAGDFCTVAVSFQPASPGTTAATLQITSDSQASPTVSVAISGTSEPVSALTLRINQIETSTSCQPPNTTAYASVTDQGGYPVLGLGLADFHVTQQSPALGPTPVSINIQSVSFAGNTSPYQNVAVASLLDFSKSLTDQPVAFADMKTGFSNLVGQMRPNDVSEIIKFATENEITQPFTTDVAALKAAIAAPLNKGVGTRLYDTVYLGVNEVANWQASHPGNRGVVVVATDGVNDLPADAPSVYTLQQAIDNAKSKNVPIFTVGIGSSIDASVLGNMATQTGGIFYRANASQNLATIFQQIASVLFANQYLVKFDQKPRSVAGDASNLTLSVTTSAISASDTKTLTSLTSCP